MNTLLIDDHTLFREGLALLITHAFPSLTLSQAGSMRQALDCIAHDDSISLALLDLNLPDVKGIESLQRLREHAPQVTAVVLSADESPETVLAALDAGAAGFIPKTSRLTDMQTALKVVLDGRVYLPPTLLHGTPVAPPLPRPTHEDALGMSPRQLDVLRLLIEGKPNKLICRELDLSESTIKTHLAAIFRKLNASSRTQAVVAAARLGLRLHSSATS